MRSIGATHGLGGTANVLESREPQQNGGSHLLVTASLTDSKTAELLRIYIRARIARARKID